MAETNRKDSWSASERAEREEMFSFHPDILKEAGELPRKIHGRDYEDPAAGEPR